MKMLIFILFVSSIISFAQWKKEYSPEVEEFMKIVEEKYQTLNSVEDELILSDAELEDAMRKMYFAIAEDPDGYANYIAGRKLQQEKDFKTKKIERNKPTISNIIGKIRDQIAEKYSNNFVSIITTPYFLRVKINSIEKGIYTDREGRAHDQLTIDGKVEEVIKGAKKYISGMNIKFMYLVSQRCLRNYEIRKSYFIPFAFTTSENSNYVGLTPQWYDCTGNYMIENDFIISSENIFQIDLTNGWSKFKQQFISKYILHY